VAICIKLLDLNGRLIACILLGYLMSSFVLTPEKVNTVRSLIDKKLISAGVSKVLVIDDAGNILTECGTNSAIVDTTSLAALAAANFGATAQIAKLIGEDDFSLLFHKGKKLSVHFIRIGKELIMMSVFNDDLSLGLIRCRITELITPIKNILEE
jgi:predicted regulator of Ras-like GTPase activity (Roadblock/LC7/MglB family)